MASAAITPRRRSIPALDGYRPGSTSATPLGASLTNLAETFFIDEVRNAVDSLETAVRFLESDYELKWKWVAIALHHALYSFCICCLENGNCENVLSSGRDDDKNVYVQLGNEKIWRRSRRVPIGKGPGYTLAWDSAEGPPGATPRTGTNTGKLISIWTALARVQDQTFWMSRLTITKAVTVSDEEWSWIEWLVKHVRNDLVHFVPKGLLVSIGDIRSASAVIVRVIRDLALESNAIVTADDDWRERVERAVQRFNALVVA